MFECLYISFLHGNSFLGDHKLCSIDTHDNSLISVGGEKGVIKIYDLRQNNNKNHEAKIINKHEGFVLGKLFFIFSHFKILVKPNVVCLQ